VLKIELNPATHTFILSNCILNLLLTTYKGVLVTTLSFILLISIPKVEDCFAQQSQSAKQVSKKQKSTKSPSKAKTTKTSTKTPTKKKSSYSKSKSIKKPVSRSKTKYIQAPEPTAVPRIRSVETISTSSSANGDLFLSKTPSLGASYLERRYARNQNGDFVFFNVEPKLQDLAEQLVDNNSAPHVALVAIEPATGKILALAEKSNSISDLSIHSGFPAASLFKVVTAAAAVDSGRLAPDVNIRFRGGTYELSQWNYSPSIKGDKREMSLGEALGKSCNPVFARVALNNLDEKLLKTYGLRFGFGMKLPYDVSLPISKISIPSGSYEFSRTAAGFGEVTISPVHAAVIMAGLANKGVAFRPTLVDRIISQEGDLRYASKNEPWQRILPPSSAATIMDLMVNSTTVGTSRKEFALNSKTQLHNIAVAGKTGTLRGKDPVGLNNWFIGAPVNNPKIAVAAIVVDPSSISTKASRMGRMMIEASLKK
jgi:peptidoglycan glycosyltransferase